MAGELIPKISEATVQGVNTKARTLIVKWLNFPAIQENVIVLNDSSSLSLPNVGDVGLILTYGMRHYYLGKIEYNYQQKIEGYASESGEKVRIRDAENNEIYAREIKAGETFISNVAKGIWMMISKGGNFSLMNRDSDGMSYNASSRITKLSGMLLQLFAGRSNLAFGRVMRNLGAGPINVPSDLGPTIPALEFFADLLMLGIRLARLHLGYVLNSAGVPEFGTVNPAARLRAILEVCNVAGISIASLKMDEFGNVELTADPAIGKIMLKGGPTASVYLGGDPTTATHPAVHGDILLALFNSHTHPTGVGPSGTPTVPADPSLNSLKVFL